MLRLDDDKLLGIALDYGDIAAPIRKRDRLRRGDRQVFQRGDRFICRPAFFENVPYQHSGVESGLVDLRINKA
ncbi:hypothetical protein SDC9_172579 [bioreactor metagenome]|uniref:Uncharacterized protein n=1 Tax=bioreactor metagenome TaxID=1076179 RepID=A0A645GGI8_9ZZZZ